MGIAWTILIISAVTDFIITATGALTAASVETSWIPGKGAIVVACIVGLAQAARTVQQALKTVKLKVDLAGNPVDEAPAPVTPLRQLAQATAELIAVKNELAALKAATSNPAPEVKP